MAFSAALRAAVTLVTVGWFSSALTRAWMAGHASPKSADKLAAFTTSVAAAATLPMMTSSSASKAVTSGAIAGSMAIATALPSATTVWIPAESLANAAETSPATAFRSFHAAANAFASFILVPLCLPGSPGAVMFPTSRPRAQNLRACDRKAGHGVQVAVDDYTIQSVTDQPVIPFGLGEAVQVVGRRGAVRHQGIGVLHKPRQCGIEGCRCLPKAPSGALDSPGSSDVPVEDAIDVVVTVQKKGQGSIHLRRCGGRIVEDRLEIHAQRFHGAKGGVRARQRVAEAPVGHLSDLSDLGHYVGANRRRLPLGARQHILAGGFHLRGEILTRRIHHADQVPASGSDLAGDARDCGRGGAQQKDGTHHQRRQGRQKGTNENLLECSHRMNPETQ